MYRNILVPVDLDQPTSWSEAISKASSLAKCFSAKVTICSVVSDLKAIKPQELKIADAGGETKGI